MKKASMKMCLLSIVVFSALLTSCTTDVDNGQKSDISPLPPKRETSEGESNVGRKAVIPSPPPKCKTCKGEFKIICPKCRGMREIPCGLCNGLRGELRKCPNCDHGKIKPLWRKEKDCDKCNGKGIKTEYCSKCSGTGRVNCKKCSGTGIIDCPECSPKAQE